MKTYLVQGMGTGKPYEVEAEDLEIDHGDLLFWVSYEGDVFLALAVAAGRWASCKQIVKEPPKEPT